MGMSTPEHIVRIAAAGLRCVEYRGHDGAGVPATLSAPIEGLSLEVAGDTARPSFHPHRSVYGFTELGAGTHIITLRDPLGRFLPRRAEVTVDPQLDAWRASLEAGGAPDWSAWDLVRTVPLFRRPGARLAGTITTVHGTVRDTAGARVPLARVEWQMASGTFETYADEHGDYVALLRDARTVVDAVTGRRVPTIDRNVRAFAPVEPFHEASWLHEHPLNFESLRPGTVAFDALWTLIPGVASSATLTAGTVNRFDIA